MSKEETPLYQKHVQFKGRISDFAGWLLPLDYGSMLEESKHVRNKCGMFDASHMGQILIRGDKTFDFFQRLTPNDISKTVSGQMQYNLFLNASGGIVDDFMSYNLGSEIFCVVNASNKDKVLNWLSDNNKENVEIVDQSNYFGLIAVQGPLSADLIKPIFGESVFNLNYMHFQNIDKAGKKVLISRSGYTGEDGFEIYVPWEDSIYFWDELMKIGKEFDLMPCGLGARDILRIEAGYPLYGHELSEEINPYQASLAWAVKPNKDFIAKDLLLKTKEAIEGQIRVGFIMQDRAFPRQGQVLYVEDKPIGSVTSGTFSPNINKFIGMAYLEKKYSNPGTEIFIEVRGKKCPAKVTKLPFLSFRTKRIKLAKEV